MIVCHYSIFCEESNVNTSTGQVSAEGFFSSLVLDGPGTTKFNFLFGISGIKRGKLAKIELRIETPENLTYRGKWKSPESKDEYEVYNSIFNCSKIPLQNEGIYKFCIAEASNSKQNLAERYLKVTFKDVPLPEGE